MECNPLLDLYLENVSVRHSSSHVLNNMTAVFQYSHCHCIVGNNGSGKSTLLKAILQLLPYEGRIGFSSSPEGDISQYSPQKRARLFAYISQQNFPAFPISMEDYILLGRFPYLSFLGNYTRLDKEKVEASMERLSIERFRHRNMQMLSGGELQKAIIARALVQDTPYLLLDEPLNALDPRQKEQFTDLFLALVGEGKTVICATHDWELICRPEVKVWGIREGRWAFQGDGGAIKHLLFDTVYTG